MCVVEIPVSPSSTMEGCTLEDVENFNYLGSTISILLSIDVEIDSRIAKAATIIANLNQYVC